MIAAAPRPPHDIVFLPAGASVTVAELLNSAMTHAEAANRTINCFAHCHYDEARAQIASGLPHSIGRRMAYRSA
jgi:hypothetical protein